MSNAVRGHTAVFDGSARSLLQSALAGRKVDAGELRAIREMLDEHERRMK